MNRFNPFKLSEHLIESRYKIPIPKNIIGVSEGESFMTTHDFETINLAEYLQFFKKMHLCLQKDIELYSEYHKIAHEIRNTSPRTIYNEGCRDTFGAGFFSEEDEYKDFRDLYWRIQKEKERGE